MSPATRPADSRWMNGKRVWRHRMSEQDRLQKELDDAALKLSSARRAAAAPAATERDKSDLKLIEQEFLALRQKARRGPADGKSQEHPQGHPTNLTEKMD